MKLTHEGRGGRPGVSCFEQIELGRPAGEAAREGGACGEGVVQGRIPLWQLLPPHQPSLAWVETGLSSRAAGACNHAVASSAPAYY